MTCVDVVHADPSSRTVVRIKQSSQLNQPAAQEVKRSTLQLVLVQVVVKLTEWYAGRHRMQKSRLLLID